ncbi:MAG: NAD(P)-binding protein, partial [Cyanobacteriota bacterium]
MTDPATSSPAEGLILDDQLADAIVIGAGAAGAAGAAELVAAGRQVVLLERGAPLSLAATNGTGLPLFRGQGAHATES